MKTVILYANRMTTIGEAHARLAESLSFPEYYGANLEDLYSLLLQSSKPIHLILKDTNVLKEKLGTYGLSLLQVLSDAAVENGMFTVTFKE